jgi:hypothetical protein
MGMKDISVEVEDSKVGEYYVSMVLRNRIIIYGPAQHDLSPGFITKLSRKCRFATLLVVLGGDFYLIRVSNDKSNDNVNRSLMEKFNMFIDLHQLQEIRRSRSRFTWTNKQRNPIMVNLDKILTSTEWESKHPLCFAWSKTRVGSNHCPIFLDT